MFEQSHVIAGRCDPETETMEVHANAEVLNFDMATTKVDHAPCPIFIKLLRIGLPRRC
jgi:hypothetical protein